MGRTICHLDGKFFEFSSVVEAPVSDLMTEEEFRAHSLRMYGEHYMDSPSATGYSARIERARKRGHSSMHPVDLKQDLEEFIKHAMCSHYGTPYEREPGNWDTKIDKWPGLDGFRAEWFSNGEGEITPLDDSLHKKVDG